MTKLSKITGITSGIIAIALILAVRHLGTMEYVDGCMRAYNELYKKLGVGDVDQPGLRSYCERLRSGNTE
jgi:hypothetical protein